jgi:hypothetical protein
MVRVGSCRTEAVPARELGVQLRNTARTGKGGYSEEAEDLPRRCAILGVPEHYDATTLAEMLEAFAAQQGRAVKAMMSRRMLPEKLATSRPTGKEHSFCGQLWRARPAVQSQHFSAHGPLGKAVVECLFKR